MKHFIIVKFVDTINYLDLVEPIKELFNKALKINGVDDIEYCVSNSTLPNRHDLMIKMTLTPAALTAFDNSEIHKQWKDYFGKYIATKTIFDCD